MNLSQTRPEPLERFKQALGVGKTGGPYKQRKKNHKPYWKWTTAGRPSAHKVLCSLWPYMSLPKREQAHKAWDELKLLRTPKSPYLPVLPPVEEVEK